MKFDVCCGVARARLEEEERKRLGIEKEEEDDDDDDIVEGDPFRKLTAADIQKKVQTA